MTEQLAEIFGPILEANLTERTITGTVVEFGAVGRTSLGPSRFAPGSIEVPDDLGRVKLLADHDATDPVGYAVAVESNGATMSATFKVPETERGDRALLEASERLRDGFSVGVAVTESERRAGILEVAASRLREVSQVALPAFDGARVEIVNATEETIPMSDETIETAEVSPTPTTEPAVTLEAAEAQPLELSAAAVQLLRGTPGAEPTTGPSLRQVARLAASVNRGEADVAELTAALADTTTGDLEGIVRPAYVNDLIGLIDRGRPVINAHIRRPLPASGMSIERPRWTAVPPVDVQSTEKTEVATGPSTIALDTLPVITVAGGSDVSIQAIQRSDPSFMEELLRIYAMQYATDIEQRFIAQLLVAVGAGNLNDGTAVEVLAEIAETVIGNGGRLDYVAFGPGTLDVLFELTQAASPGFWTGQVSLGDGTGTMSGGVNVFPAPQLPTGTIVGGDREAMALYEPAGAPFRLEATRADVLGVDVAVYGYHAIDDRYASPAGPGRLEGGLIHRVTRTQPAGSGTQAKGKK